tara:strand:+ start:1366 stop:1623 length:258 start_codon:yes stop_codon:yes gene_type:complete
MNKGILYFSAPWCGPCQALGPIVDQLGNEGISIKKVNIDYETDLTTRYNIKSVPTLVLTDLNGNEIKRLVSGGKTLEQLKSWYNG